MNEKKRKPQDIWSIRDCFDEWQAQIPVWGRCLHHYKLNKQLWMDVTLPGVFQQPENRDSVQPVCRPHQTINIQNQISEISFNPYPLHCICICPPIHLHLYIQSVWDWMYHSLWELIPVNKGWRWSITIQHTCIHTAFKRQFRPYSCPSLMFLDCREKKSHRLCCVALHRATMLQMYI